MPASTHAARRGTSVGRGLAVVTLAIAAIAAAPTVASAAEIDAGETYDVAFETEREAERLDDDTVVVERGDTLSRIAADVGLDDADGWRVLYDANDDLDDPDLILPGQELAVPEEGDELERREVSAAAPTGDAAQTDEEAAGDDTAATSSEPAPSEGPTTASGSVWDRLAQCESNGDWSINTGNGFYGGLQFHPDTWAAHGGHEYAPNAHQATREQEIVIAERVLESQGWGAWPACSSELGLR